MNDTETRPCPSCGNVILHCAMVTDKFPYGVGKNPIILKAEVLMFSCDKCGESFTGEQAEEARMEAIAQHQLAIYPMLVKALIAQHRAIDVLFAMLVAKTMHAEEPFYPTTSGQPWQATVEGNAAIALAGGDV